MTKDDRISKSDITAKLTDNCPEKIKLYYFNPNDYGLQFFVAETSKKNAYNKLIQYFKRKKDKSYYKGELKAWEKVNINNPTTYPEKYSIDEYEIGEVIESEIA